MSEISVKEMVFNHEKAFLPETAEGINAVIQYKLTGDDGGDYIITIQDGKCTVAEGEAEAPTITLQQTPMISGMSCWAKRMVCSILCKASSNWQVI